MLRKCYNIARNVVVAIVIATAMLYASVYIAVSLPPVQKWLGNTVANELQKYIGGEVQIGHVEISPFNRLTIRDIKLTSPKGEHVADIDRLGAGISMYDLFMHRKIVVTYAELIGLKGDITQPAEGAPLNIQYIIDAVSPKDKNKPPTRFDLSIHSIVLRKCSLNYDKLYLPQNADHKRFDPNHIHIHNLRADIDLPRIANDNFEVDIKRISLQLDCGLDVKSLRLKTHITNKNLTLQDFSLELPNSIITLPDIELAYDGYDDIPKALLREPRDISIAGWRITPADLQCFVPQLGNLNTPLLMGLDATVSQTEVRASNIDLKYPAEDTHITIQEAKASGLKDFHTAHFDLDRLSIKTSAESITDVLDAFAVPGSVAKHIEPLGNISILASASGTASDIHGKADINTSGGNLKAEGRYQEANSSRQISATVSASDLEVGRIAGIADLGACSLQAEGDITLHGKNISGDASITASALSYRGYTYHGISIEASRHGNGATLHIDSDDANANFTIDATSSDLTLPLKANHLPELAMQLQLNTLRPEALNLPMKLGNISDASLTANMQLNGGSLEQIKGNLSIDDLRLQRHDADDLYLSYIDADVYQTEPAGEDRITLKCPFLKFEAIGDLYVPGLPAMFKQIADNVMAGNSSWSTNLDLNHTNRFDYTATIQSDTNIAEQLALPVKFLSDVNIYGSVNSTDGIATVNIDAPWIQQGKNKLIRDTHLQASLNTTYGTGTLNLGSTLPAKKSDVRIELNATANGGNIDTRIDWKFFKSTAYYGTVGINGTLNRDPLNGKLSAVAEVQQSDFLVNDTVWHVNPAKIEIVGTDVSVNNLKIWREGQFALIDGRLSADPQEQLHLALGAIDLTYIFDVLDINFVTFGGEATGDFYVSGVTDGLDKMVAYTPGLQVKDFAYNHARLGNALIKSRWMGDEKMVRIDADVEDGPDVGAKIGGGIWVTRDSLSFDFDTRGINVQFLQPFMAAFSSDVSGKATGHAKLYGTFSDIDLVGKLYAHPLKLKIDYTNVYYTCTDTVELKPGIINIDNVVIQDRDGHKANLNGYLKHRYFHDPVFEFRVSDARDFLCYDTNAAINPVWYGTIFGNGGGTISGRPGLIDITIDMATASRSKFYFVLDKTEAANDYRFITFTDRRKQELQAQQTVDTIPEAVKRVREQQRQQQDTKSLFTMDLRATVTPEAQLTLVMDPVGGDRIRANGNGSLQIGYNSDTEEMTMFGRYTLDKGIYNFTLQDLILKDFIIRPGSTISFNGDPYSANLDIAAAYRVNANLADLDKSFATDRDLTRTNVPVEAMLLVKGDMQNPVITFDLEIPTVTQDVVRKVKSIISTDDMMSRQIVYLLALNRFYTPEYTGTQRNNNELASVASSTVSAQLGNAFGRLSDNWSFTPYFRTEKGDFSDLEVDLALSSSLLNNRLLLNGNFGYRDRATSTTTFVGDFDIEYLLNRQGTIRLKAYNHFNDANYYLRQALTTQGVGVMYKLDFDDLRNLFRRKRKPTLLPTDTIPSR